MSTMDATHDIPQSEPVRQQNISNARFLWRLIRAEPWMFGGAVLFMALVQLVMQLTPLITREFFNLLADGSQAAFDLWTLIAFLMMAGLAVYAVLFAGWSSNNKYSLLGAMRASAQTLSYEVFLGLSLMGVVAQAGSFNMTDIVNSQRSGIGTWVGLPGSFLDWNWLVLFPMFVVFFISALAETNRPPFDLPEAESELVAGFMVEYSSTPYLLFMLGEYVAIVAMCAMTTILFLGGWLPPINAVPFTWVPGIIWFLAKLVFVFFMFAMVKAMVPRYRYDQLMRLGWKVFLPLSLAAVIVVAGIVHYGGIAP